MDIYFQVTRVQNNQIDLFEFYNFNNLGCKNDISIFRLSLSVLTAKTLPKNQRLKAQRMRRKEKHFSGDNATFCLRPAPVAACLLHVFWVTSCFLAFIATVFGQDSFQL
jgi:hypothetical protein